MTYLLTLLGWASLGALLTGVAVTVAVRVLSSLTSSPSVRSVLWEAGVLGSAAATASILILGHQAVRESTLSGEALRASTGTGTPSSLWAEYWLPVLGATWLIGATVAFVRLVIAWRHLWVLCRGSRPPALATSLQAQRVAQALHVARPWTVREAAVESTCVAGIRPAVVLVAPSFAARFTDSVPALLAHELAHVARRDFGRNLLVEIARRWLWWHPAVQLAAARARVEREFACDDLAAAAVGSPEKLATALVLLEAARPAHHAILAPAAGTHPLVGRVRRLVHGTRPHRPTPRRRALATALVLLNSLAAGGVVAWGRDAARHDDASTRAFARSGLAPAWPMIISAHDPAGAFSIQMRRGRVERVTLGGTILDGTRLTTRGDSVVVHDVSGTPFLRLAVDPRGGVTWHPREARRISPDAEP